MAAGQVPMNAVQQEQFEALLPLARLLAHKYEALYHRRFGEFLTAAYMGAWTAVTTFDGRGRLRPWATLKIRGSIIDGARQEMATEGGKSRRQHLRVSTRSLDGPIDGEGSSSLGDLMECPRSPIYYNQVEEHDLIMHLKARMDEREWQVLSRCVCNEETLKVVGESLGFTESRCCQILKAAKGHAQKIIAEMAQAAEMTADQISEERDARLERAWIASLPREVPFDGVREAVTVNA